MRICLNHIRMIELEILCIFDYSVCMSEFTGLRELLKLNNLSQADFGTQIGRSQSFVSRLCRYANMDMPYKIHERAARAVLDLRSPLKRAVRARKARRVRSIREQCLSFAQVLRSWKSPGRTFHPSVRREAASRADRRAAQERRKHERRAEEKREVAWQCLAGRYLP